MKRKPLFARLNMLHGADYNPEQWEHIPGIWDEDMRMMKLANCNVMSIGMFSWTRLEPSEGHYEFGWLDEIMDKMYANGINTILSTPSGARPAWLSQRYPEVLRVQSNRVRNLHGLRHNHCYSSPIYREKVGQINAKLAERYRNHPGLLLWHLSNEYGGECHCPYCQQAFREFLKKRYDGDLQRLNQAWWSVFWSHEYTDWEQIESPSPIGESKLHGLNLDWRRFVTAQSTDFMKEEIKPLKRFAPDIPVTTNFMGDCNIDYARMAEELDIISWDSYPQWHGRNTDAITACDTAFTHDLHRSFKPNQPFLLMESTPSMTNWQEVAKLKKPGMHVLASIQAVAHGSDSVQYFQWRKSRGSSEKFHGAVVDHCGHEHTRVFNDVMLVGEYLQRLDRIVGTTVQSEVALIYDWENRWGVEGAEGPHKPNMNYRHEVLSHYESFWKSGVSVDVIAMERSFEGYKLIVAPMLYMVKPEVAARLEKFVQAGGVLILTYWSGIVDETDLCFLGGFPGPLRKLAGIWAEELDALYPDDRNSMVMIPDNQLDLTGEYSVSKLCELVHLESASVLATYKDDFYKGYPALTLNQLGNGGVYYMAAKAEQSFLDGFYKRIMDRGEIKRGLRAQWAEGVTVQVRTDGVQEYIFIQNYTQEEQPIILEEHVLDYLDGSPVEQQLLLPAFGFRILTRNSSLTG